MYMYIVKFLIICIDCSWMSFSYKIIIFEKTERKKHINKINPGIAIIII